MSARIITNFLLGRSFVNYDIFNHILKKFVPSTPYKLWIGKYLDLHHMRPWGSTTYVHDFVHLYGKLGS